MKNTIVLYSLGVAFFGNIALFEKYAEVESAICKIFFKGNVHSKEVEKLTDEGREYFETEYYFTPADRAAKIGKQFVGFALIEIGFCSILLTFFFVRQNKLLRPRK